MSKLKTNDLVCCKILKGPFQYDHPGNHLLISTGTGIAPFLSLLKQKREANLFGQNRFILIHGSQYQWKDQIQGELLRSLKEEGKIVLL